MPEKIVVDDQFLDQCMNVMTAVAAQVPGVISGSGAGGGSVAMPLTACDVTAGAPSFKPGAELKTMVSTRGADVGKRLVDLAHTLEARVNGVKNYLTDTNSTESLNQVSASEFTPYMQTSGGM
ncbi:hypothetical protein [Dactylosporangium sp. CA-092794]|uniref:hypothetical protein n=1 Tax=Dactylosporangium sp. CA-092794 TaxID=3239929 RepID=UPI003D8CA269